MLVIRDVLLRQRPGFQNPPLKHPRAHASPRRVAGGKQSTILAFKGAMNPKAGERGRRAQRQCLHINPHLALDGVHRPWVLPPPQQQALLGRVEGWLPALYGGGEKAAKYHRKASCQRTQGPRGREAHPSAAEVCGSGKEVLYLSLACATLRKVQASSIYLCSGMEEDVSKQPSQRGRLQLDPLNSTPALVTARGLPR